MDLGIIQEKFQKSFQESIDRELKNILMGNTSTETHRTADPIKDLQDMICKITTVVMCSPNTKKKIEEIKELSNTLKIIPSDYLEDDKIYLITDEKMKKFLLGYGNELNFS